MRAQFEVFTKRITELVRDRDELQAEVRRLRSKEISDLTDIATTLTKMRLAQPDDSVQYCGLLAAEQMICRLIVAKRREDGDANKS